MGPKESLRVCLSVCVCVCVCVPCPWLLHFATLIQGILSQLGQLVMAMPPSSGTPKPGPWS